MAVVVTVALVPVAAAYLQLGYVAADGQDREQTAAVTAALDRTVGAAENRVAGEYAWSDRDRAVAEVRDWLAPRVDGIEAPGDPESVVTVVTYNQSLAAHVAATACPGTGDGRAFGPCVASRGVVVQERAGETVVVAVALDVRVVSTAGVTEVSFTARP
jgi:hypothetical protein